MSHNVLASVLVIDDHPVVRIGIIKALTTAGFNCIGEAGSLKEATAMIALHNPQVITVDINLPDGNGQALLALAAASGDLHAVPCIAVSADGSEAQVIAARAAGFADFWPKPIDLQRLLENTGRWLAAAGSSRGSPG